MQVNINNDQIPTDYIQGYEKARQRDPQLAATYVAHTMLGDPQADAVIEDLAPLGQDEAASLINAAMQQDEAMLLSAPQSLRTFMQGFDSVPDWYDYEKTLPACRAFYKHWYAFTGALLAAGLIEGFTTGIAKSFMYTGRLLEGGHQAERRLKQNNRHQAEIFLPGGLERQGEGFKLTLRIRLVHAQVRHLLREQDDWHSEAWGVPISAAHIGLAAAVFSGRILGHVERLLGMRLKPEEKQSFMDVWRYTGYLMGVPEPLQCYTQDEALHLFDIATLCEPPPDMESVVMANTLINAAPVIAGLEGTKAKRLLTKIYRVSRALIGDDLADQLQYPKLTTRGILTYFTLEQRMTNLFRRVFRRRVMGTFEFMTTHANYEKYGISYYLPDSAHAELSKDW